MNGYIFVILMAVAIMASAIIPFLTIRLWLFLSADRGNLTKAILWLIYGGSAVPILVSDRKLSSFLSVDSPAESASLASPLVGRLLQLFAVFFGAYAAHRLMRLSYRPQISRATILLASFFLISVVVPFLGGVFGAVHYLLPTFFLMPVVFLAATTNSDFNIDELLRALKGPLVTLLSLSCILVLLIPGLVLEPYPIGKIPNFPFRMWGLTLHANALGPLGFLLLLIEFSVRSSTKVRRFAVLFIALACLVLAQSKTAWLGGLASVALLWIYGIASSKRISAASKIIQFCFVGSLLLIVLGISIEDASQIAYAANDRSLGGGDFSGRTRIWDVAMGEWRRNPVFGYGPAIWSPDFRENIGMNFAFHAHSQFYQTVGESGWVGLVALSFYLLVLIFAAYSGVAGRRPFLAAYLAFILIRCVSEPTFRTLNAFGTDAMLHLPLFLAAFSEFSAARRLRSDSQGNGLDYLAVRCKKSAAMGEVLDANASLN